MKLPDEFVEIYDHYTLKNQHSTGGRVCYEVVLFLDHGKLDGHSDKRRATTRSFELMAGREKYRGWLKQLLGNSYAENLHGVGIGGFDGKADFTIHLFFPEHEHGKLDMLTEELRLLEERKKQMLTEEPGAGHRSRAGLSREDSQRIR